MPYTTIGPRGTRYRPAAEALADTTDDWEYEQLPDGTIQARKKMSTWEKIHAAGVIGGMGYGAATGGTLGFGGSAALPSGLAGSPELVGTGIIPGVGAGTGIGAAPAIASAGTGAVAADLLKKAASQSVMGKIADALQKYGPTAIAGINTARSLMQGPGSGQRGLEGMMATAQRRVDAQEPIFDALTTMAKAQMPKYTRGV